MNTPEEYIKHVIVKCKARGRVYYTTAGLWAKAHWITGVINGVVAASISVISFIAKLEEWDNTIVGMMGGVLLAVSTSISTSLKTGQNQRENEQAGDDYLNLAEKLLAEYSSSNVDHDTLRDRCQEKLEKLTNQYSEPNPEKTAKLEKELYTKIFTESV